MMPKAPRLTPVPSPGAYCVALTGPTFETRAKLKEWGFHWNQPTRNWIRLIRDHGSAKNLARHMRGLGYIVALHPARAIEIPMTSDGKPKMCFSDKKLAPIDLPVGKARAYRGMTDFSVHYSGGTHGWSRKSRRR